MNILIANLPSSLIESDVLRLFVRFGEVESVQLIRDKLNNRSLCRAFIEMPVQGEAEQAIVSLNKTELNGKKVAVTEVLYDPAPNSSWAYSKNA